MIRKILFLNVEKATTQIQQKMLTYGVVNLNRVEASCKVVLEKIGYAKFENILADSDVLQKQFHEVFLE